MTKPLSSYPESERKSIVTRRLNGKTCGLGFLSARDFENSKNAKEAKKKKPVLPIEDVSAK